MRRMAEIRRVERRSCNAGRLVPLGCWAPCMLAHLSWATCVGPFVSCARRLCCARRLSCQVAACRLSCQVAPRRSRVKLLHAVYLVNLLRAIYLVNLLLSSLCRCCVVLSRAFYLVPSISLYRVHLSRAMTICRLFLLVAMLATTEMLCKHLLFSPCFLLGFVAT